MTDSVGQSWSIPVTIQNVSSGHGMQLSTAYDADPAQGCQFYYGNVILDTVRETNTSHQFSMLYSFSNDTVMTSYSDPSGYFPFFATPNAGGIYSTKPNQLNYGHYQVTTVVGGETQIFHLYFVHEDTPSINWVPKQVYTSTPAGNGYGSNQIGTLGFYTPTFAGSGAGANNSIVLQSDSSGALEVWNDGRVFLNAPVSAGTITAVVRCYSSSGKYTDATIKIPVLTGTSLTASNISGTITSGLTNFVPYANQYIPTGSPVTVLTGTVSGFAHPIRWDLANLDIVLGTTVDNAQVANTGNPAIPDWWFPPRYAISGSGTSFSVTATNLSAHTDHLRITLQSDFGEFCIQIFDITPAWHTPTVAEITVGPANANYPSPTFTSPNDMLYALWHDFIDHGAAAIYAGTSIRILRGCPFATSGTHAHLEWGWGPNEGASSNYTGGWIPFPIDRFGDDSIQAQFVASISGSVLTVTSVTGGMPGLYPGDVITPADIGSLAAIIMSQLSGATHGAGTYQLWIGPDNNATATASVSSTTMHTKMPHVMLDGLGDAPGGTQQGGFMHAGGYDQKFRNLEIYHVSAARDPTEFHVSGAACIWGYPVPHTGDAFVQNCYFHDSNNGWLNGGRGQRNVFDHCLIAKCGDGGPGTRAVGTQHNIYMAEIAQVTVQDCVLADTLTGNNLKSRAQQTFVTNSKILDGSINCLASRCIDLCEGGYVRITGSTVSKLANVGVQQNPQFLFFPSEMSGGSGNPWAWYINDLFVDTSQFINQIALGVGMPQLPIAFTTHGSTKVDVGFDPTETLRNTPILVSTGTLGMWNLPRAFNTWNTNVDGGVIPTFGGSTVEITDYPESQIRLVDPATGTPPFNLPQPGGVNLNNLGGSVGSAPGTYGMTLTVPSGSPTGTNVSNGLLCGIDFFGNGMTGNTYAFGTPSGYTLNNSSFTLTAVGDNVRLKTNGSLADGLYLIYITCTGTGDFTTGIGSQTMNNFFLVVVGNLV